MARGSPGGQGGASAVRRGGLSGNHFIVDLVARGSQVAERAAYAQVLGVLGVAGERLARCEFGDEDDIAGVVDAALVDPDLELQQAWNPPAQGLELGLQQ